MALAPGPQSREPAKVSVLKASTELQLPSYMQQVRVLLSQLRIPALC
jgi:hypothetical protein